ncbi:MAG: fibronectin type III domain-containing protein [Treponema sp.]|jgi:uncharacterized repeat protein (TIGR02543 family)|nr:fibronectin type III domain-containing protein [Treponema sp.]
MRKSAQNFILRALIAAAAVFMFAGCAELFHGEPAIYMVEFYNLSSRVDSREVEAGLELGSLPAVSNSGYTLAGWYTEPNGDGTEFTSSTIIKEDVRLYAKWQSGSPGSNTSPNAPSAPTGVTAAASSSGSIVVSWSQVSGATEYTIYHSDSASGTYSYEGTSSSTSYTDTGLLPGTTHYYKVSASNSAGEGVKSSYTSATTTSGSETNLPSTPTNVTATASSSSSIEVSWSQVSGATEYKVYRSDSASGTYVYLVSCPKQMVR